MVLGSETLAHSADTKVEQTTVCNIVNFPWQFIGKAVEIRAQIWADDRYRNFFWMNESSIQLNRCAGSFRHRSHRKVVLAARQRSAPFAEESSRSFPVKHPLSGPIPLLQLYDRQTAEFVRPEN
jgi:hypothetical protein